MTAYKDNNGTWYVKLRYTDYSGKKRQKMKRGFKLLKAAKEWETDFMAHYSGQPDITFKTLYSAYIDDKTKSIKASTLISKSSYAPWFLQYFGDMAISDITPFHINEWQKQLKGQLSKRDNKPLSASYMRAIKGNLSAVFNHAVKYYHLASNPCAATENIFDKSKKHMDFWTKDEFDCFINTFKKSDPYYAAFNLLYYTGLRIGELLALTVGDIDFDKHTIRINKTLYTVRGKEITSTPKTENSNRSIVIPKFLCEILQKHIARIYEADKSSRLFYYTKLSYTNMLRSHAVKADIKPIRVHDLRHSHASLLIELGFSALLVSERLGHAKVSTTLNIYSHLFPSKQAELADRLDTLNK